MEHNKRSCKGIPTSSSIEQNPSNEGAALGANVDEGPTLGLDIGANEMNLSQDYRDNLTMLFSLSQFAVVLVFSTLTFSFFFN